MKRKNLQRINQGRTARAQLDRIHYDPLVDLVETHRIKPYKPFESDVKDVSAAAYTLPVGGVLSVLLAFAVMNSGCESKPEANKKPNQEQRIEAVATKQDIGNEVDTSDDNKDPKPDLSRDDLVLVSRSELDSVLRRFGYDPYKDAGYKQRNRREWFLSDDEVEFLSKRSNFKALQIVADFYEITPEYKAGVTPRSGGHTMDESDIIIQNRRNVKDIPDADFYVEAIAQLTDDQIAKIKKLFSYVEFNSYDRNHTFSTLGELAHNLAPLTDTVEELQQAMYESAVEHSKKYPNSYKDKQTGEFREPKLEDWRKYAEESVARRKARHEDTHAGLKILTSKRAFEIYDFFKKEFGYNVFDNGLHSITFNISSGINKDLPKKFLESYSFEAKVTDELRAKVRFLRNDFGWHRLDGKQIDELDKVSMGFLEYLGDKVGDTITDSRLVQTIFGGQQVTPVELSSLAELEANKPLLDYLDSNVQGGLWNMRAKFYDKIKGQRAPIGKEFVEFLLGIAKAGGTDFVHTYRDKLRHGGWLSNRDLELLYSIGDKGNALLTSLVANSNNQLTLVELANLPVVAKDQDAVKFATSDASAKFLAFDPETIKWFIGNRDKIDDKVLGEVYKDAGKVSRFDMPLVAALSQDDGMLRQYKDRAQLEAFAREIYSKEPMLGIQFRNPIDQRPDISSLSSLDLLKIKLAYDSLNSEEGKKFLGNLIWSDINEYKPGAKGDKFESELSFSIYYKDGRFIYAADKPASHKFVDGGFGFDFRMDANNSSCMRPEPTEKDSFYALFRGHLHATSEDNSDSAHPSSFDLAKDRGIFVTDMYPPNKQFSNELVVTTSGLSGRDIQVGTDLYRVSTKDGRRVPICIDLGKSVVPYEKAETVEK
jgi:hypothetical protein